MRKWIPRHARHWRKFGKPGNRILHDWWKFVKCNPRLRRLDLVRAYVTQQLGDSLDPSTIKSRLISIRRLGFPTTKDELQRAREKLSMDSLIARLDRMKNRIGTKFKALHCLQDLRSIYSSPAPNERDRLYQLAWYLLVATGQRPANLVGASFRLTDEGVRVIFREGRKTERVALRCGILFLFAWSERPPPPYGLRQDEDFSFPSIGTTSNVAANLNSWLKKHNFPYTSTVPRVRLDNVLRELITQGLMDIPTYERLMNHQIATSDKHYYVA